MSDPHERLCRYLVDLAEGRVPKEKRRYRIRVEDWPATDDTAEAIRRTEAYPVWLLDPVEAERELLRIYHAARSDRRDPPPVVERYVLERIARLGAGEAPGDVFLSPPNHRPKDRDKELDTERLRAEIEVERRRIKTEGAPKGETALTRVAERHDISEHTLEKRLRKPRR